MKNNFKFLFLILALFLLSGCTKQMKDSDSKIIRDSETNQILVENILCKPKLLKDTYESEIEKKIEDYESKYKAGDISKKEYLKKKKSVLNIDSLPDCKNLTLTSGGYESLWTNFFVKPLAWIIVKLGLLINNYGFSIILVTLLIKIVLFPFSSKTLKQSEDMKKIQPKLKAIERKYANKNDQQSIMMKNTEIMELYKKYNVNPLSSCLIGLIQIPLFFAFYEAMNRLPALFENKFLVFHMGMTPLAGMDKGNWIYLILPILVGVVTYFSFKMNQNTMSEEQEKQMKTMLNIMIVMIFVTSFSMSTAIIIYWIANSLFTIIQNIIFKRSKV